MALSGYDGPVTAVTDYMKAVPDQIARFIQRPFYPLGTDGYGRSDTREALRHYFGTDTGSIVLSVLHSLVAQGSMDRKVLAEEMDRQERGLDGTGPHPDELHKTASAATTVPNG